MSEKKGSTVKVKYDFDTGKLCEVNYVDDKWARVTPREFRSFNSKRRIDSNLYEGPIYYYNTNIIVSENELTKGIQFIEGKDSRESWKRKRYKLIKQEHYGNT